jgi:uncharacterized protein YndB with AHSA1/START domain
MDQNLIAETSININGPCEKIWNALVTPDSIKQYMFGTNVISNWHAGDPIIWKGEWQGKGYEDKGEILQFIPGRILQYSHYSPLSSLPDAPSNYHTVTIELHADGDQTRVSLTQDNNSTDAERLHSEQNWQMMLNSLKQFVEK